MAKNNKIKFFFKYYFPILCWMGIIFYFSSLRGNGLVNNPDFLFYLQRKGAHIFEYFVLAILFWRILKFHKIKGKMLYFSFSIFTLIFAISDEIHQTFVFGREGKLSDVGIDLVGVALAIFAIRILNRRDKIKKCIL